MSKTTSDQLNEVNAELLKLKSSIEEIKEVFERSNIGDITSTLESVKIFMQQIVSTLSDIKKSIGDLSGESKIFNKSYEQSGGISENRFLNQKSSLSPDMTTQVNNIINKREKSPTIKQTTIAERPILMAYPAPTSSKPQEQAKDISSKPKNEILPKIQKNHSDAKQIFDAIIAAAHNNTFAKELGKMIDTARGMISKSDSLNPILFELSMEAGRLKIMGEKSLNKDGIEKLEETVNKWKIKC